MRTRHLAVKVIQAGHTYRELLRAEYQTRALLMQMPRDSTHYSVRVLRERLATGLKSIRVARGRSDSSLHFELAHRAFPESVKYTSNSRKEVLQELRLALRQQRSARKPATRPERLNSYSNLPPQGVKYTKGLYLLAQKMRVSKVVFESKKPLSEDQYLGIELEFICQTSRSELGVAIADAGLSKYVHLHSDGSVRYNEARPGEPLEISLLVRQSEMSEIVPRLTAVLDAQKCYVNATCGMHVHVDMRKRDPERSFAQLVRAQPTLYAMCPPSRKANQYCKPTRGVDLAKHRRTGVRYKGINACAMSEHRTLEVRIHSGTLSAEKITNWVRLLLSIVDGPELKQAYRAPARFARHLQLSDDLRSYVLARIAHFNTPSVETDPTTPILEASAPSVAA